MSNVDSFIDEVTEEVRRDRLYGYLKRYGWIAALVIFGIVAGAGWREYSKARDQAAARALGDAMVAALAEDDTAKRAAALGAIKATSPGGAAVLGLMRAAAEVGSGRTEAATAELEKVIGNGEVPDIYRQIARFKLLLLQGDTLSGDDRRAGFEALANPGAPLRLLAEEQWALIDVAEGNTEAALARWQALLQDAEADSRLQQRASQMIVALGGKPQPRPDSAG